MSGVDATGAKLPPRAPDGPPRLPRTVPAGWRADELQGVRFTCLEGCGFCCTFTPQVSHAESAALRGRFPRLPVTRDASTGTMHLAFQGGCGACTLLSRRQCSAYDLRPAHCRYFPFHVYFGRRTEVYVNRTCRGVEAEPGGDLGAAFAQQVLAVAPAGAFAQHERQARRVVGEFERNARDGGVWHELGSAIAEAVAAVPAAQAVAPEAWRAALAAFCEEDVVSRPFYLAPDLRWLTFANAGGPAPSLTVVELHEDGTLTESGTRIVLDPTARPTDVLPGMETLVRRLAQRDLFAGWVAWTVDDSDYAVDVEEAARRCTDQAIADLVIRAGILRALDVPPERLADEAVRFYDSAFLDKPTIGGWL